MYSPQEYKRSVAQIQNAYADFADNNDRSWTNNVNMRGNHRLENLLTFN